MKLDWLVFCDCGFQSVCPLIGEGNGTPLQYSCLENPMDGGAWWAIVHGVAKSRTRLSNFLFTFHFHALEKEMATHSSVLAWRIPGKGEPGGLPSMGLHRVGHTWSDLAAAAAAVIFFVKDKSRILSRIRSLWKLPDGRDWLREILGPVLMGRAMLSKSLIQFSVDGWSYVPSLLLTLGQTMVQVIKINYGGGMKTYKTL